MGTYSFKDVQAAINGPGGAFSIGQAAGAAEEGISVEYSDDISTMQVGAGGEGQHNLHASMAGSITVRLLKTSRTNALMEAMFNYQRMSASRAGQNTITIRDVARGDTVTGQEAAFRKFPNNGYGANGPVMEWVFNCVRIETDLGVGTPSAT